MSYNLSFEQKVERIKQHFVHCSTPEQKYHVLIALGRNLSPFPPEQKIESHIVKGCQSQVYLIAEQKEGRIYFQAASDALISAGLAAVLIEVYSGETAQAILQQPPHYLQEIGIAQSLTPSRAGGLANMHLHMQKLAVPYLLKK